MKDIKIDTLFMKIQYWISWIGFIILGLGGAWIIAIFLASYGKTTSYDADKKKDVLNKTWQKFVFIYGSIVGDFLVVGIIWAVLEGIFIG